MLTLLPLLFTLAAGRSTDPPKVQSHTCSNGLTVLVVENHSVPLVTIEIAAKNGSMTEPVDYNGLSHLYEHMFFKANKALPSQEAFLRRVQELGLDYNGTTNTERVNYYFTGTKDRTEELMQFMHDAVVTPIFDPKELDRERVVVTGEMDINETRPGYHLFKAVSDRVWWKYPSRKQPLGNRETVLKTTVAQMRTIQRRYYVPNNSVLVVTGDVAAADIFVEADKLYTDWAKGEDPFVKYPLVKHPPIKKTEAVVVERPVQVIVGSMTWHGPSVVENELAMTYAADAFTAALAEPSSKWTKATQQSGACVFAQISWQSQQNVGPISVSFQATTGKVDACVTAILGELSKMESPDYASQDEMHRGSHMLEVQQVHEREKPSELAHQLTFWWCVASIDYYLTYADKLFKATPVDAAKFVTTYIKDKPFVLAVMVSPAMKKAGLDQKHFESLLHGGAK